MAQSSPGTRNAPSLWGTEVDGKQKGEATAKENLLGLVAMATVHTLRVGEGHEYANQALGWHPQPLRACV